MTAGSRDFFSEGAHVHFNAKAPGCARSREANGHSDECDNGVFCLL